MNIKDIISLLEDSGYAGNLDLDPSRSFSENGIDSLDVFSWLAVIEEKYGISVDDEEFSKIKTPADLLEFVNNKLSST